MIEHELPPPGADLWAVLGEIMETRAQQGRGIEPEDGEPRYGSFFCRKDGVRLYITIQPTDPAAPKEGHFNSGGPPPAAPKSGADREEAQPPAAKKS